MRAQRELYLAQLLRDHRADLERMLDALVERGEPVSAFEVRLIVDFSKKSLEPVEGALIHSAATHRRIILVGKLQRAAARVRSWFHPRIGRLHQYAPKALTVPRSYLAETPPAEPPTISVVTPSFCQGHFIERTIYSVVSQRYPALEYVVQDGLSTDDSVEVIRRYERHLASWVSETDAGQADAINRGFARTSGEIMAWLNSDDLLLPGALACVARYFAEHPEVDVVYGHRLMIDEEDGQIGAWIVPEHDDHVLAYADYVPQETLFWRRRIWDAAGGYVDPTFRYALDWELLLRFREAGARMVRLPRFLGAFRVHDQQKTTADGEIGVRETKLLRERVHGRGVGINEVLHEIRPYLRRHVLLHNRMRAGDRLFGRAYVPVRTRPPADTPLLPAVSAPAASEGITTQAVEAE